MRKMRGDLWGFAGKKQNKLIERLKELTGSYEY